MLKGWELGLGLAASFEFIQTIQGKPTLSPRGALALVMRSGELASMAVEGDTQRCRCWMKRRNSLEFENTVSIADAQRAGLVKTGSGWESWPANMLRWRSIGFTIDVLFSDICGGLKRADEFGATVDDKGNVVETWPEEKPAPNGQQAPVDAEVHEVPTITAWPVPSLEELIDKFGASAVLDAAGGVIPSDSTGEIVAVAEKLGWTP
jgi:hypothetical protein